VELQVSIFVNMSDEVFMIIFSQFFAWYAIFIQSVFSLIVEKHTTTTNLLAFCI